MRPNREMLIWEELSWREHIERAACHAVGAAITPWLFAFFTCTWLTK